jgi:hypothetical protein
VKTATDKRAEDLLPMGRSDRATLWIDDATGQIVDRTESRTEVGEVRPAVAVPARRRMWDGRPAFTNLVRPRPLVTMEDGARVERPRLSWRVVRLLPARGGGS